MKKWIVIVLLLQLAVLAWVVGKREWIYHYGERVYLRTAPVDPRDFFRGDYVQLDYELAHLEEGTLPKELAEIKYQQVYLSLQRDRRGLASLVKISTERPDGLYIKGYLDRHWHRQWGSGGWGNGTVIKLGIEKYFVEQGKGLSIEEERGRAQEWQTPMEVDVAIGDDGTALIRGFRWSDMGIRLEVLEMARNNNNVNANTATTIDGAVPPRVSPKLRISLRNQSDREISLLDTVDHCAFQLVENMFNSPGAGQGYQAMTLAGRPCQGELDWQLHSLQPDEVYAFEVDLDESQWYVAVDGKELPLGALQDRWAGFRWLYQVPDKVLEAQGNQEQVWQSPLRTARFDVGGRID